MNIHRIEVDNLCQRILAHYIPKEKWVYCESPTLVPMFTPKKKESAIYDELLNFTKKEANVIPTDTYIFSRKDTNLIGMMMINQDKTQVLFEFLDH